MKIRTAIANTLLCALSTPAVAQLPNVAGEIGAATQGAAQVQTGDAAAAVQSGANVDTNVNTQSQQATGNIQTQAGTTATADKTPVSGTADLNAGVNTNVQGGDNPAANAQLNTNANVQAGANSTTLQANSSTAAVASGTQASAATATNMSANTNNGTAQPYTANYGVYDATTVNGVVGGQSSIMSSPVVSSGYTTVNGSVMYPGVQTASGVYSTGAIVSPVNYTQSSGMWTTGSSYSHPSYHCPQRRLLGRLFRAR